MLFIGILFSILFFAVGYLMPDLLRDPAYHEEMEEGKYPENITVMGKEFVNTRVMSVPPEIEHSGIIVENNRLHDQRYDDDDIDSRWSYEITVRNTADSAVWINRETIMMAEGLYYDNNGQEFTDVYSFLSKNNDLFLLDINETLTYETKGITKFGKSIAIQDFDGVMVMAFNATTPEISPFLTELDMRNITMGACVNGDEVILADVESINYSGNSSCLEVKIANGQYNCDAVFVSAGTDSNGNYFSSSSSSMDAEEKKIFYLQFEDYQAVDVDSISMSIHQTLIQLS
ncbi:MAG: hypothetical protein PWQ75_23 [Methanolobus sp.]|jgi:hypothetical protein|nr:hypothetical protein [Methanolobus sp.]